MHPRSRRAWVLILPVDLLALSAPIPWNSQHFRGLTVMAFATVALLAAAGLYRPRLHLSFLDDLPALTGQTLIAMAAVAGVTALRHNSDTVESFLRAAGLSLAALLAGRAITFWIVRAARRRGLVGHPAVIIGSGRVAADLVQVLDRHRSYGLEVVGYLDDEPAVPDPGMSAVARLGGLRELAGALTGRQAEVVLVADPHTSEDRFGGLLQVAMAHAHDILVVPRMHQFQTQSVRQDHIGAIPIMRLRPPMLNGWRWALKRSIDLVLSAIAVTLLSPVLLACAVAVRAEGGPGVLFRQERVGRNGRRFDVLKFRSMRPVDETESRTNWSIATDDRVGPVGRVLRRTSLDELPQLWNILRGDMTIVGPRPERPYFVEQFSAEHPHYANRHRVPVGLTGLAQVSGLRGDTPISDRARFDNYYIENWSLWLDFKIVVRTVRELLAAGGR